MKTPASHFRRLQRHVGCFLCDDGGATAIEYTLLLVLIFLAIVGGMSVYGDSATSLYSGFADKVLNALKS